MSRTDEIEHARRELAASYAAGRAEAEITRRIMRAQAHATIALAEAIAEANMLDDGAQAEPADVDKQVEEIRANLGLAAPLFPCPVTHWGTRCTLAADHTGDCEFPPRAAERVPERPAEQTRIDGGPLVPRFAAAAPGARERGMC